MDKRADLRRHVARCERCLRLLNELDAEAPDREAREAREAQEARAEVPDREAREARAEVDDREARSAAVHDPAPPGGDSQVDTEAPPPAVEPEASTLPRHAAPPAAAAAERPAAPVWQPPPEFAEFTEVTFIGAGGMGRVYRARDRELDRLVALKFISTPQPDSAAVSRFRQEAQAVARLNHPNVMQIYRVGHLDGRPYLVAEWIAGQRLDLLPRPVPPDRVLRLALGLSRGLAAAHAAQILHRDIKPGNVLVDADDRPHLLDFGLAQLHSGAGAGPGAAADAGAIAYSGVGPALGADEFVVVGTPRYMPPEILLGAPATPQSDVFSLGLVLYELCVGGLPQRRGRPGAGPDSDDHPGADLPPLARVAPEVPPGLSQVVDRCLRRDPAERFASGAALRAELERLYEPSLSPLPPGNPYRGLRPFEAEHRALFFGRGADIRAVVDRLRSDPLVLVAGDSGVGKSSLCRAGVIPEVQAGALGQPFVAPRVFPGRRPLQALAAALAGAGLGLELREDQLLSWLRDQPEALGAAVRARRPPPFLLYIDQAEELVTLSDPDEAARFARAIGSLLHPAPGVRVLMSLRADFLTRLLALEGLGEHVQRALYLLRPLTPRGLREAIVGPARRLGVVFDDDALSQMGAPLQHAGELPLLQFALAELWDARDPDSRRITAQALQSIGGVAGALSRHAEGALHAMPAVQQRAARRLLTLLVSPQGTRARRAAGELGLSDPAAQQALAALVDARLLCVSGEAGEPVYELSHEVLIQSWGTLRGWLQEDSGARALRERVAGLAAEWERHGQHNSMLLSGRALKQAVELGQDDLAQRERDFVRTSRRARGRRRALAAILGVLVVLLLGQLLRRELSDRLLNGAVIEAARRELLKVRGERARYDELRAQAYRLFDQLGAPGGRTELSEAEGRWLRAQALHRQLEAVLRGVEAPLRQALARDPSQREARALLREVLIEWLLLEQGAPHEAEAEAVRAQLAELSLGEGAPGAALQGERPARLRVQVRPAEAQVVVAAYERQRGYLRLQDQRAPVPAAGMALLPGSYLLIVTAPGRDPVRVPVLLEAGEERRLELQIPERIPPGYAYVPAGELLYGSADDDAIRVSLDAPPLHRVRTEAYLIARDEVTFADWMRYLDARRAEGVEVAPPSGMNFNGRPGVSLTRDERGAWALRFDVAAHEYRAGSGERLIYLDRDRRQAQDWRQFPVTGLSVPQAQEYLRWLGRAGGVPGARMCDEYEWERAARGADGRPYPMGDPELPDEDDANIDKTYRQRERAFGLDEVGSHPQSDSPVGLHDMMGNAFELVRSVRVRDGYALRGGSFYKNRQTARSSNHVDVGNKQPRIDFGLRVCAAPSGP